MVHDLRKASFSNARWTFFQPKINISGTTVLGGYTYIGGLRSGNALVTLFTTQADIEANKSVAGSLKTLNSIRQGLMSVDGNERNG